MHRVLVIRTFPQGLSDTFQDKFAVIADSQNPEVTIDTPHTLQSVGATQWDYFDKSETFDSPFSVLPHGGKISQLGFWHVVDNGENYDFDFTQTDLIGERKVVTSGTLHIAYQDRHYYVETGDSLVFVVDKEQAEPFIITFYGDSACTATYVDFTH